MTSWDGMETRDDIMEWNGDMLWHHGMEWRH